MNNIGNIELSNIIYYNLQESATNLIYKTPWVSGSDFPKKTDPVKHAELVGFLTPSEGMYRLVPTGWIWMDNR